MSRESEFRKTEFYLQEKSNKNFNQLIKNRFSLSMKRSLNQASLKWIFGAFLRLHIDSNMSLGFQESVGFFIKLYPNPPPANLTTTGHVEKAGSEEHRIVTLFMTPYLRKEAWNSRQDR